MALVKEIKYLFLAHVFNAGVPVLLIPLLAQRLGVQSFGQFVVLTGSSVYLAYAIELGFNNVAIERFTGASDAYRKKVFTTITLLKCILMVAVIGVGVCTYRTLLNRWGWDRSIAWVVILPSVTCLTYPAWLFIAENKQKVNFVIQLITKIFLLAAIWLFVKGPSDVAKAVAIYSFSTFIVSIPFSKHWLRYLDLKAFPKVADFVEFGSAGLRASGLAIRDAWSANGLAPLLGLLLQQHHISEFALAEKMVRALATPASSFGSILLANHSRLQTFVKNKAGKLIAAVIVLIVAYAVLAPAFIVFTKHFFPEYERTGEIFVCMVASVPFIYVNYSLLNYSFILERKYSALTIFVGLQGIFAVALTSVLAIKGQWIAAACAVAFVEIAAFGRLMFDFRKKRAKSKIRADAV